MNCLHVFLFCVRVYVAWVASCVGFVNCDRVCVYKWVCLCSHRPGYWAGAWACFVGSPWLVGDVGIRGRLERWLHNVFALMIPTVCSSYQLLCTGFHGCRGHEITHPLFPYTPSFSSPPVHPTTRVRERSDPGRVGKQTHRGKTERKGEMDMYCRKFIDGEGDLQRWPLVSTEALARVVIVHWDNTLTPRRALGLQCNVPAELQHITEGAVGRIQW